MEPLGAEQTRVSHTVVAPSRPRHNPCSQYPTSSFWWPHAWAQSTYKVSLLHVWLRRGADRPEATLSTGVRTRFEQKESGGLLKNTEDPGALSHTAFKLGLFFCIFQLLQLKNPHVARKGPTGPSLLISLPSPGTQESVGGRVCW